MFTFRMEWNMKLNNVKYSVLLLNKVEDGQAFVLLHFHLYLVSVSTFLLSHVSFQFQEAVIGD